MQEGLVLGLAPCPGHQQEELEELQQEGLQVQEEQQGLDLVLVLVPVPGPGHQQEELEAQGRHALCDPATLRG